MAFSIESYNFNFGNSVSRPNKPCRLSEHIMGTNWPVVYILHGKDEVYIGETNSANGRMEQHLDRNGHYKDKRKKLDKVEIIFDSTFNKSAILDIENSLIGLFRFEIKQTKDPGKKSKRFKVLQNGNSGQSKMHNYFNRAHYQDEVEDIWGELKKMGLATNDYQDIVNDTIFKFSPYTALNEEQREVTNEILNSIMDTLEAARAGKPSDYTAIVNGVAGTGKTIVLINLIARVIEAMYSNKTNFDNDNDDAYESANELGELSPEAKLTNRIKNYITKYGKLKIAYVAQMSSLRNTIGTVLKEIPHLHKKDAKGPNQIVKDYFVKDNNGHPAKEPFDILFIDEAHRLWQHKKLGNATKKYRDACAKLYGPSVNPDDLTTLDWLFDCSRTRVLVYDQFQTVKDSDITPVQFNNTIAKRDPGDIQRYTLKQQMRCRAGVDYISYVDDIFNCVPGLAKKELGAYTLAYYDDPNKLISDIITKDGQVGLCKCATGYGWQWIAKKYADCEKKYKKWVKLPGNVDTRNNRVDFYLSHLSPSDGLISLNGQNYVRNLDFDWIIKGSPREIGCIHTSQGYDLNYVGVLFGPEIDYDPTKGIIIYPKQIKDTSVGHNLAGFTAAQQAAKIVEIKNYIVNAYKVMMERGIKGCFIYAYNPGLKAYLSKFFENR